jgi:hypothetical protein
VSKTVLRDASITVNGKNLSDHCSSLIVESSTEQIDVTPYPSTGYREYVQGANDTTITAAFYQDHQAASVHQTLAPIHRDDSTAVVLITPDATQYVSTTNPSYLMASHLLGYQPLNGGAGGAAQLDVVFRNADPEGLVQLDWALPLYIGNATSTEFTGEGNIPVQIAVYFGSYFSNGQPLTGRPQAYRAIAKYGGITTADTAQGGSTQVVLVDTGTSFTQTLPVAANESNALIQGANRVSGKSVAHSFSIEAHQTARIDEPRIIFAKEVGARDVGTRVDDWVFISVGDPATGSAGSMVDRTALRTKLGVHLEDYLTFGTLTTSKPKGYLASQASSGASTITMETGQGAGFSNGNTLMIGTGALAESRTIQSIATDVITLTATLSKTHPAFSAVYVHSAAGFGNLYMSAGRIKSDVNLEPPGINAGQYQVRFTNGSGFMEYSEQSSDAGAPSTNNCRVFAKDNGSGKTQLVVRFPTGANQILATEP